MTKDDVDKKIDTTTTDVAEYVDPGQLFSQIQVRENLTLQQQAVEEQQVIEDLYPDFRLTKQMASRFKKHMRRLKNGFQAAIPLNCNGPRCPFYEPCAFRLSGGEPPEGHPCIVELPLYQVYRQMYAEDFEVDMEDRGSIILINELAELDIYDFRATMLIAMGDIATDGPVEVQDEGRNLGQALIQSIPHFDTEGGLAFVTQDVSAAFNLKERLKNRKLKILELLVATRKEKYKRDAALKMRSDEDIAEEQGKQLARIAALTQQLGEGKTAGDYMLDIQDAEFTESGDTDNE